MEAQEERLRSVRTMMDAKEEQYRSSKFDLHSWESRSKELSAQYQEMDRFRVEHGEKLDVVAKRFEHLENRQEEIADMARRSSRLWCSCLGLATGVWLACWAR